MSTSRRLPRPIVPVLLVAAIVTVLGFGRALGGEASVAAPSSSEKLYKGPLDPIGPFSWLDLDGRRWTDRDFRGKVLIVEQWAAACGPCVSEFPEVQKLYEAVRHDPSIAFVSLDLDQDPAAIREFLGEFRKEYSFPVLFAGAQLKIKSIPRMWIVDRDGYIRESLRSPSGKIVEQTLALVEGVKHRPPVSTLPTTVRDEMRKRNEIDGLSSR